LFHAAILIVERGYADGFWKNLNLREVFFPGPDVQCDGKLVQDRPLRRGELRQR